MPGIFISLAISFLLFLYAPVDLYCANTAEFWFDFSTLLITALGMFAACFAVLAVLYLIAMLIHPYVYRITLAGGIALFICTYIQGNFMIRQTAAIGRNFNLVGQIRYSPERYIASLGSSADRCNCGNDRAAKAEICPCGNVHQRMHDPDASGYRM